MVPPKICSTEGFIPQERSEAMKSSARTRMMQKKVLNSICSSISLWNNSFAGSDYDDDSKCLNLILAQFEKVARAKSKWKCVLKEGVMTLENRDILFGRGNGEFHWWNTPNKFRYEARYHSPFKYEVLRTRDLNCSLKQIKHASRA